VEPVSEVPDGHHDLVVIGASAGGVETLRKVVGGFPADLRAAILIVLHVAPSSPSALAHILRRAGALPCRAATDGEALHLGEILVAPPDRHLVVEGGRVRLTNHPRENGHRPSVDVLFRTAAMARDIRVVGVVLSGMRDDGSAGLAMIKAQGGATIVQDPAEALYAGMPASALAHVHVDSIVPSGLVADAVVAMVNGWPLPPGAGGPSDPTLPRSTEPITTVCPECGGVLSERAEAGVTHWECRVGHRYSAESLINAQAQDVEAAMWAAVRALEDRRQLLERMAEQLDGRGQQRSAHSFRHRAHEAQAQADAVRIAVSEAAAGSLRELEDDERADTPAAQGGVV